MSTWAAVLDLASTAARDTFGTAVTYTRQGEAPESVVGVFDPAHVGALVGGEVGVTITGPVLDIVLADLGGDIDQGDTCTINGIGYAVEDIEVDGHGNAKLWLRHT